MNNLTVFNNKEFGQVRTLIDRNYNIYFVAKDVAKILGYTKLDAMYRRLHNNHKIKINPQSTESLENAGFPQIEVTQLEPNPNIKTMVIISESGLYKAIMGSTIADAERFQNWVTDEVLPTIRKHGVYMTPEVIEKTLTDPDFLIKLATELKEEKAKRTLAEQKVVEAEKTIKTLQPKADYYDLIINNPSLVTTTQIAKDYGMAAKSFNALLHKLKVQYKKSEQWLLYCKYQDKGYVSSETISIKKKDNTTCNKMLTKWTQSGRLFLYNLLKDNNILPVIERQ